MVGDSEPEVFLTDGDTRGKSGSGERLYSPTSSGFDYLGAALFLEGRSRAPLPGLGPLASLAAATKRRRTSRGGAVW